MCGKTARCLHPAAACSLAVPPPGSGPQAAGRRVVQRAAMSCMDAPCLDRADSREWSNARGNQAAGAQGSRTRAWGRAAEDAEAPGAGTNRGSIILGAAPVPFCGSRSRPPSQACKGSL